MKESNPARPRVSPEKMASAAVRPRDDIAPARGALTNQAIVWREYVLRIAQKDQAALGALYDETSRIVYSLTLHILNNPADAEEVTLDTYTQVWRSAATFDAQRGSVLAWLMTIARSRAIDRRRSTAARSRREEPLSEFEGPESASTQPMVMQGLETHVRSALNSLSSDQREAIELAYFFGYSHSELAAKLNQPLGTIKTRIRLGMIRLRSQLADLWQAEGGADA